jgi:hypothetical protein
MDRTRIPRGILELTCKGTRRIGRHRTRWFGQILEDIKTRGKRGREIEKDCGKEEEIGDFSSAHSYKTETMLEEEEEDPLACAHGRNLLRPVRILAQ